MLLVKKRKKNYLGYLININIKYSVIGKVNNSKNISIERIGK